MLSNEYTLRMEKKLFWVFLAYGLLNDFAKYIFQKLFVQINNKNQLLSQFGVLKKFCYIFMTLHCRTFL